MTAQGNIELALAEARAKTSSGQAAQHFLSRSGGGFQPMTMLFKNGTGFYAISQHKRELLGELLASGWRLKGHRS